MKISDTNTFEILAADGKTHVVLLYSTTCKACEDVYMKIFYSQIEKSTSDIPQNAISIEVINEVNEPEKASFLIQTFHLSDDLVKEGVVLIYNDSEGYIIPLSSWDSEVANKIIHRLTNEEEENYYQEVSAPVLAFLIGLISGFNPCIIALLMLITVITSKKTEFLRRSSIIIYGIFYAQVILMLVILLGIHAIYQTKLFTWIVGLTLFFLGSIHILDAIHSLYSGGSELKSKSSFIPFKTPEFLKNKLKKMTYIDNPYFDFFLGNLFGIIKSPCILAPFALVMISGSENLLLSIILYNVGNITLIMIFILLIMIGILKSSHLSKTRFCGRLFQRGFIGIALIISALLILMV